MSKRLVIFLIIILVVLNLGFVGFLYYKMKVSASEIALSADAAVNDATNSKKSTNLLKLTLGKSEIPKADVAGVDVPGLTRYRDDVRSSYNQNTNGTVTAEYKTTAAANVILSYYKTQLAENDWILLSADSAKIVFTKDKKNITITAATNSNGITTYSVNL